MQMVDLISPDRVACDAEAGSKKRALEELSALIAGAQSDLSQGEIFDSLISRERLGSTGLGHGVALPHGRVKNSEKTIGAFVKLRSGIDFDAVDREPVDLLFALLVPENSTEEHLNLLAKLAEMFSDAPFRERLREAHSGQDVYDLLSDWHSRH